MLGAALVAAWCLSAIFVAVHRPAEPLSIVMVVGALIGAFALFGAALAVRDAATLSANDWGAAIRAVAVAILPAVGLQLALGLARRHRCARTARRVTALLGYVVAAGLAVYLLDERPDVPIEPIAVVAGVFALVAIVGFFARCRAARTAHERARMQWVAWAVVVAGAISIVVAVLHALVSWPEPVRGIAVATTVLIPLSLAFGASERIAVRIDRLLVHTITLGRPRGHGRGVLPPHRAGPRPLADRRRADAPRLVDARGRGRRAAVDPGARATHRRRDASGVRRASRARRGAAHVRQPAHARACRSTSCCSSSRSR